MKICVTGLGYIGLPTALLLSKSHDVFGCDVNEEVVDKINNKIPPFTESGLEGILNGRKPVLRTICTYPIRNNAAIILRIFNL